MSEILWWPWLGAAVYGRLLAGARLRPYPIADDCEGGWRHRLFDVVVLVRRARPGVLQQMIHPRQLDDGRCRIRLQGFASGSNIFLCRHLVSTCYGFVLLYEERRFAVPLPVGMGDRLRHGQRK
jgi:hypothetical protein